MQYRHGDLLLEWHGECPIDLPEVRECVLAVGEATGHAHRLSAGVPLGEDHDLVAIPTVALLTHEEHRTLEIPPGVYRIYRQREWTPERTRRVRD